MLLDNQAIIVTGAASPRGIGKATARALAAQGARVAILDLRREDAEAAAAELGRDHLGLACDVTDRDACVAAAHAALEHFGRIDGLVNNAGITQPVRTLPTARALRFSTFVAKTPRRLPPNSGRAISGWLAT